MHRRIYLTNLGTALSAGCPGSARRYPGSKRVRSSRTTANCRGGVGAVGEGASESGTTTAGSDGVRITGVFPREVVRTFFDYEYVELTNGASGSVDVSGYALDYGDGHVYSFPSVEVEPAAQIVVSSRSGDDVTLDRAPPICHLFAGFGQGDDTSVLDGSKGRLVLRDADGTIVDTYSYGDATREEVKHGEHTDC